MKQLVIFACLCGALAYALPVPNSEPEGLELVQIPLNNGKELDILSLTDDEGRLSERNKRTIGILRDLFPELTKLNGENSIDVSALNQQLQETIRVVRQAAEANENQVAAAEAGATGDSDATIALDSSNNDQQVAESKSPAIDELTLEEDGEDADDRNKRFLSFGFGGNAGASASASSGGGGASAGSGNFLFDIIRLFSGSVSTQQTDATANAPDATATDDGTGGGLVAGAVGGAAGYTEGIPGPVTRLFVLANRGLANLIQDLILRIAATSERVVNFKARLITSLI